MGKGKNKFGYSVKYGNPRPVKATRLRNKVEEKENESMNALGVILYILSFVCLILACLVLGVW
jgi:hypothetical protein